MVAHFHAFGVSEQTCGQVHQIGTEHIQHRHHKQRQTVALSLPLFGKRPLKLLGYPAARTWMLSKIRFRSKLSGLFEYYTDFKRQQAFTES
jgi:hypothetical protein